MQGCQPFETQKSGAQPPFVGGLQRLGRIAQRSQQQVGRGEVLSSGPHIRRRHGEQSRRLCRGHTDRRIFDGDGARRVHAQRLQSHIVYVRSRLFVCNDVAGGVSVKPIERLAAEACRKQRLDIFR